jgi:hypothetical protein
MSLILDCVQKCLLRNAFDQTKKDCEVVTVNTAVWLEDDLRIVPQEAYSPYLEYIAESDEQRGRVIVPGGAQQAVGRAHMGFITRKPTIQRCAKECYR